MSLQVRRVDSGRSQCIRSHHTDPKATGVPLLMRDIVRSILPGLRRKMVAQYPKSSFRMKVNFAFNLIQGPRVEEEWRGTASKFLWIWFSGVDPLCFIKSKVNAAIYQEKREMRDTRPNTQTSWRPLSGLHNTSQADRLHATMHRWSNSCKRYPNQVWVNILYRRLTFPYTFLFFLLDLHCVYLPESAIDMNEYFECN